MKTLNLTLGLFLLTGTSFMGCMDFSGPTGTDSVAENAVVEKANHQQSAYATGALETIYVMGYRQNPLDNPEVILSMMQARMLQAGYSSTGVPHGGGSGATQTPKAPEVEEVLVTGVKPDQATQDEMEQLLRQLTLKYSDQPWITVAVKFINGQIVQDITFGDKNKFVQKCHDTNAAQQTRCIADKKVAMGNVISNKCMNYSRAVSAYGGGNLGSYNAGAGGNYSNSYQSNCIEIQQILLQGQLEVCTADFVQGKLACNSF